MVKHRRFGGERNISPTIRKDLTSSFRSKYQSSKTVQPILVEMDETIIDAKRLRSVNTSASTSGTTPAVYSLTFTYKLKFSYLWMNNQSGASRSILVQINGIELYYDILANGESADLTEYFKGSIIGVNDTLTITLGGTPSGSKNLLVDWQGYLVD